MGKTRSTNRKKKYDDACSKNTIIKTSDNNVVAPWSDLDHDMLFSVMMRLGVVDFLAFSGVCKSWRSLALSNKNMFMVSKPPMSISISTDANNEEEWFLEDFEGRKVKIALPQFAGRRCVGVTCGYLILMGVKTNDFWLVNLITGHELHFHHVPNGVFYSHECFKAILVFSPSISRWVFLVLNKYHNKLWFCISGKRKWSNVSTPCCTDDLHAFKGKIYTLHSICGRYVTLCEMILHRGPKLVVHEIMDFLTIVSRNARFLRSGEHLYVIDRASIHATFPKIHELDFGKMEWVSREIGQNYAFFHDYESYGDAFVLRDVWANIHSQYWRFGYNDKIKKGLFHSQMWYFFHDCLNVNRIHN